MNVCKYTHTQTHTYIQKHKVYTCIFVHKKHLQKSNVFADN